MALIDLVFTKKSTHDRIVTVDFNYLKLTFEQKRSQLHYPEVKLVKKMRSEKHVTFTRYRFFFVVFWTDFYYLTKLSDNGNNIYINY